jgi:hypothetical protein
VTATDGGRQQRRVVIACQGGESHTAFTAGVLKRLLGAKELAGYQVSGLSGTSGGAVCALLAWYALLDDDPAGAGRLLDRFWADNSARGPVEMLVNNWIQWAGAWQDLGVALPTVSPYHWPASVMGADQFCAMLGRQVDFGRIQQAGEFLAALAFERAWAANDVAAVMASFAADPEVVSAPPFTDRNHRGSGPARQFVQEQLSAGVRMDLTRKLVARERVSWMLRRPDEQAGTDLSGQAQAQFQGGKITSLRLGPLPPSP